ncbi:MAG: O-antigen ligase family protein, partial [Saprospiraceae bacterium]|nr:O-antigen ligase family protein [Saprospiraceae bacterium]
WICILLSILLASFQGTRRVLISIAGVFGLHFRLRRGAFIIAIILFTSGPLIYTFLPEVTRERIELTFESGSQIVSGKTDQETLDIIGTGRWTLLLTGLEMWSKAPIMGIGVKNNVKYMDDFGGKSREARIHNFYAEVLVDMGIVGFLSFLFLTIGVFVSLYSMTKRTFQSPFLGLMIMAFTYELIMIHVVAFFGHSMLYNKEIWVLYALAGSLAGLNSLKQREKDVLQLREVG